MAVGPEKSTIEHHQMQCMEVWGGNDATERSVGMPGLDAWVFSRPCRGETRGGDVHYVTSCATGRITRLLLADISGHGFDVAGVGENLRHLLRRFINHVNQRRVVASLNRHFSDIADEGSFATAIVATFFAPRRTLDITNAGHPPPLHYSAAADRWQYLHQGDADLTEVANVPLGVDDRTAYTRQRIVLDVGDLVLCYTDSLPDSICADGSRLGLPGLLEIASSLPTDAPDRIVETLIDRVEAACPAGTGEDDLTMLLLRPTGAAASITFGEAVRGVGRIAREMLAPPRAAESSRS